MTSLIRDEMPTVLVTGAATGIGLATARLLAANKWRVLGTALPDQDSTALRDAGAKIVEVDLTSRSSLTSLIRTVSATSRLDALVSNAGIAIPGPLEGLSADELHLQFGLNTIAPMILAQGVLPQLRASGGRMIFMGAGQGRAALPFGGPYGASKAALAALTDALRTEIADSGVAVSLIEPSAVRTDILTTTRERGQALLDRLPHDIAERYRDPMRATFARSEKALRGAIAPDTLSQLVLRVLTTPNPKPRYLVGREAVGLAFLALLPARQRAKLVSRISRTRT
ncbi:SDR family NAD(P)-dependent oxidoreductase [Brevibacterium picturae]|uniref:SDR family oxidoreductase n=1 Tax=Brevibacterium picturae TaxID=260553 RepID=A0ABP4MQY9_9MICO